MFAGLYEILSLEVELRISANQGNGVSTEVYVDDNLSVLHYVVIAFD